MLVNAFSATRFLSKNLKKRIFVKRCLRFFKELENGSCLDIDECVEGQAMCPSNSRCLNSPGSFQCECVNGYKRDNSGFCRDIDECDKVSFIKIFFSELCESSLKIKNSVLLK